jgi:3-hydroxy acid dehydrogenase/malonic semialdehyde reductase
MYWSIMPGLQPGSVTFMKGRWSDWEQMIDTNIKGLLYITRLISPGNGGNEVRGISSISDPCRGKRILRKGQCVQCHQICRGRTHPGPCAIDLVEHGIKVTSAIHPGAVETEFSLVRFKGDQEEADKVYEGFTPLYAEDVADAILFAVTRPPHVNIDDLLIMPAAQARSRKIVRKKN